MDTAAANIVHVVESLDVGGLERMVISLAAWQRAHGARSRIVCLFHAGALAAEAESRGIPVQAVGKVRGLDLSALRALRRALAGDAGAVHTHNAVAHYHAALAVAGLGAPCLVNTRHGMGRATALRMRLLYRCALAGTHRVAVVCRHACDAFVAGGEVPRRKACVIPNGIAVERFSPRCREARERLLVRLGRPAGTWLVGTVGRMSAVKDQATLLQAIAQLRAGGRTVDLVMVGDGEQRPALAAQAAALGLQACVHLVGMRDDVPRWLQAFDVLALTSRSEGYSLALVEAAAAALPVVATQVGGNAEIVEHGVTGWLVPPQDPAAVAQALMRLLDDPEGRRGMGAAARRWAFAHGSLQAMGQAYAALYAGAAGVAPPAPRNGTDRGGPQCVSS